MSSPCSLLASLGLAFFLTGAAAASEQGTVQHVSSQQDAATSLPPAEAAPSVEPPAPPRGYTNEFERRLAPSGKLSPAERADREALKQFYSERYNEPVWVTPDGYTAAAQAARDEIGRADEWGLQASAFRIPALPSGVELTRDQIADAETALSLAILQYARHARGGRTDPLSLSVNLDRQPPLLDPRKVIETATATWNPDSYLRSLHPQHPQFGRLRQKYLELKANGGPPEEEVYVGKGRSKKKVMVQKGPTPEKLLVNMEQWRWMPEDLGSQYVWVNIPEYTVRVMKDGHEVHSERVVVGRPNTPTPIFSDQMEHVIFQPFWNVPDSIKTNELLPNLMAGDSSILSRQGLKMSYRGKDIHPSSVDWSRADIRRYHVYQPPGGSNALGMVKFMFPNKHDVYLHDTPSKHLFSSQARAFSHGCIRVRNPLKFAEVLLGNDRGWTASQVTHAVKRGPEDNRVDLNTKVPVHLTYFTVWIDDNGHVQTFADVYDHEHRIAYGLAGKPHLIRREPEIKPPTQVQVRRTRSRTVSNEWGDWDSDSSSRRGRSNSGSERSYTRSNSDWMQRVFPR